MLIDKWLLCEELSHCELTGCIVDDSGKPSVRDDVLHCKVTAGNIGASLPGDSGESHQCVYSSCVSPGVPVS